MDSLQREKQKEKNAQLSHVLAPVEQADRLDCFSCCPLSLDAFPFAHPSILSDAWGKQTEPPPRQPDRQTSGRQAAVHVEKRIKAPSSIA